MPFIHMHFLRWTKFIESFWVYDWVLKKWLSEFPYISIYHLHLVGVKLTNGNFWLSSVLKGVRKLQILIYMVSKLWQVARKLQAKCRQVTGKLQASCRQVDCKLIATNTLQVFPHHSHDIPKPNHYHQVTTLLFFLNY